MALYCQHSKRGCGATLQRPAVRSRASFASQGLPRTRPRIHHTEPCAQARAAGLSCVCLHVPDGAAPPPGSQPPLGALCWAMPRCAAGPHALYPPSPPNHPTRRRRSALGRCWRRSASRACASRATECAGKAGKRNEVAEDDYPRRLTFLSLDECRGAWSRGPVPWWPRCLLRCRAHFRVAWPGDHDANPSRTDREARASTAENCAWQEKCGQAPPLLPLSDGGVSAQCADGQHSAQVASSSSAHSSEESAILVRTPHAAPAAAAVAVAGHLDCRSEASSS